MEGRAYYRKIRRAISGLAKAENRGWNLLSPFASLWDLRLQAAGQFEFDPVSSRSEKIKRTRWLVESRWDANPRVESYHRNRYARTESDGSGICVG
jgi:hypothetical protein